MSLCCCGLGLDASADIRPSSPCTCPAAACGARSLPRASPSSAQPTGLWQCSPAPTEKTKPKQGGGWVNGGVGRHACSVIRGNSLLQTTMRDLSSAFSKSPAEARRVAGTGCTKERRTHHRKQAQMEPRERESRKKLLSGNRKKSSKQTPRQGLRPQV